MTLPNCYRCHAQPCECKDGITLYHADCRDVLPLLEPGSVGAVITDPPFGINHAHHSITERRLVRPIAGDGDGSIGQYVLSWAAQTQLPTCAFASPKAPWPGKWRNRLVWDKGPAVGGGGDTGLCWKQTWELIMVARNRQLNGARDQAVLRYWSTPDLSANHPSAKPLALMRYLVEKLTDPSDTILDPFCGSGTTLVAAKVLGRRCIGIEIEERYCAIAAARLESTRAAALPKTEDGVPIVPDMRVWRIEHQTTLGERVLAVFSNGAHLEGKGVLYPASSLCSTFAAAEAARVKKERP